MFAFLQSCSLSLKSEAASLESLRHDASQRRFAQDVAPPRSKGHSRTHHLLSAHRHLQPSEASFDALASNPDCSNSLKILSQCMQTTCCLPWEPLKPSIAAATRTACSRTLSCIWAWTTGSATTTPHCRPHCRPHFRRRALAYLSLRHRILRHRLDLSLLSAQTWLKLTCRKLFPKKPRC